MATCRLCKERDDSTTKGPLIKYEVRHYAHAECAMERWGAAFFDRLTPWQAANQFPYFTAKKYHCADSLIRRAESER